MDTTIGSSVQTPSISSTISTRDLYYTKFVSPLIYQTSIAANTWVYAFVAQEGNIGCNCPVSGTNQPVYVNIYVWRPSTGVKVGTILDGNTASTVDEAAATARVGHVVNCTGASVAGLTSGDAVIIIEIWFRITSTISGNSQRFEYDGGTAIVENATNSDGASYLETPENLTLTTGPIIRTISETAVTITGSINEIKKANRSLAETTTISEILTKVARRPRAISEAALSTTDTINEIKKAIRSISDSSTITDSLTRKAVKKRYISDPSTSILDSLTRKAIKKRYLSEPAITTTDSIAKLRRAIKSITESTTITDLLTRQAKKFRYLSESPITVTDALTKVGRKLRYISESLVSTTDSVTGTRIAGGPIVRTITEAAINITDSLGRTAKKLRYLSESSTINDSLTRKAIKKRYITDPGLAVTDSLARLKKAIRTISETTVITEVLTRKAIKSRRLAESITITDQVLRLKKAIRSISESTIIVDSLTRKATKFRRITESPGIITDSLTRLAKKLRYIQESLATTDSVVGTAPNRLHQVFITEPGVLITDSLFRFKKAVRTISEISTITDSCTRLAYKFRRITETIIITGVVVKQRKVTRVITDPGLTITDSLRKTYKAFRYCTESLLITDTLRRQAKKLRYIQEPVQTITDTCTAAKSRLVIIIRIVDTVCTGAVSQIGRAGHRIFGQNQAQGF